MNNKYDYMCQNCGGLVPEPMKPYGYAGNFCHCHVPVPPSPVSNTLPCNVIGPHSHLVNGVAVTCEGTGTLPTQAFTRGGISS